MLRGADHAENCQFLQSHGSVISGISYCGVCPGNAGFLACFAKISALLIVQKQARTLRSQDKRRCRIWYRRPNLVSKPDVRPNYFRPQVSLEMTCFLQLRSLTSSS